MLAHPEGETRVRVETRAGTDESFGVGKYETMRFRDFVARFAKGDETVYLTASPASVDAHGRPEVASAPASFLVGENRPARVPFRPGLAGNLVPANVNLWLGAAGSVARMPSSGLHHDHHDNLYVLLRGEKRVELYAPDAAEAMYTTGAVRRVHANGRIDYEETGARAEDGDDGSLRRRVASHAVRLAEAEVERAQAAVDAGTPGAETALERGRPGAELAHAPHQHERQARRDALRLPAGARATGRPPAVRQPAGSQDAAAARAAARVQRGDAGARVWGQCRPQLCGAPQGDGARGAAAHLAQAHDGRGGCGAEPGPRDARDDGLVHGGLHGGA